jgi:hypothetical protein
MCRSICLKIWITQQLLVEVSDIEFEESLSSSIVDDTKSQTDRQTFPHKAFFSYFIKTACKITYSHYLSIQMKKIQPGQMDFYEI